MPWFRLSSCPQLHSGSGAWAWRRARVGAACSLPCGRWVRCAACGADVTWPVDAVSTDQMGSNRRPLIGSRGSSPLRLISCLIVNPVDSVNPTPIASSLDHVLLSSHLSIKSSSHRLFSPSADTLGCQRFVRIRCRSLRHLLDPVHPHGSDGNRPVALRIVCLCRAAASRRTSPLHCGAAAFAGRGRRRLVDGDGREVRR